MASRTTARSVKDATRFTSTIPHATSKSASTPSAASQASAAVWKQQNSVASHGSKASASIGATSASSGSSAGGPKGGSAGNRVPGETPEQRVRRLRAAHMAAQRAQISSTDRLIDTGRRIADIAHRWTVTGLVAFTVIAGVVSIYSVWDMLRYNRARRAEWLEAQKKLEAEAESGSLAAARLAYVKGTATEDQIIQVEAANKEAEEKGLRLPPLIDPPARRTHFEETFGSSAKGIPAEDKKWQEGQGKGVVAIWGAVGNLFGVGKESTAIASTEGSTLQVVTDATRGVQDRAQAAWDSELENQRKGGALDRLGTELDGNAKDPQPTKRSWRPW